MAVPPVKKNRFKQLKQEPELLDRLVVEWDKFPELLEACRSVHIAIWPSCTLLQVGFSFVRAHSEHLWTGQTCTKGDVELNWQVTVGYMLAVPPGARFSEEIIAAAIMAYYSKHSLVPTGISQQVMLKWDMKARVSHAAPDSDPDPELHGDEVQFLEDTAFDWAALEAQLAAAVQAQDAQSKGPPALKRAGSGSSAISATTASTRASPKVNKYALPDY
ncbi:unnamed protein product, partial [Effrenium voratum]